MLDPDTVNQPTCTQHSTTQSDASLTHALIQVLDPFAVLGLTPGGKGVTEQDVKKAYRKLALTLHPDKAAQNGLDPATAETRMKEVRANH